LVICPPADFGGEVLVDVNARVKAKFIPLDQSMSPALLTYEKSLSRFAD
jgi:hypothetical protein